MMKPKYRVSRAAARKLALTQQHLHRRPPSADSKTLLQIIRKIGLLQLDSINVTARSHYLVMLSRAGLYHMQDIDSLLTERHLFEQWAHAACLIPVEDYPFFEPVIHSRRGTYERWYGELGENPRAMLDGVLEEIRASGPLSSKDFETERPHRGTWWNWKPAKLALEILFLEGRLMVNHRRHFHRYYDLPERVLNDKELETGKTMADYRRWATVNGLRPQGIATLSHIADYYRQPKKAVSQTVKDLVREGAFIPVEVEDWKETAFIHQQDQELLQMIDNEHYQPILTTFLSPFDNLIWHRERTEELFDFRYRVEMYTPAAKRKYGYYVLPILHKDRLVGRIDPKIERASNCFIIRGLYLEKDAVITDELIAGIVGAIREFMAFHSCASFQIEKTEPTDAKSALLQAM